MTHRVDAAKHTLAMITTGSANMVAVAGSAAGLSSQLNRTHPFLYLDLPMWYFFVASFILSAIGSMMYLIVDSASDSNIKASRKATNLLLGFVTGIVGAFIILPTFTDQPPMPLLLITSLVMSFTGAVLLHNIGDLVRNKDLWTAIKNVLKDIVIERLELIVAFFLGGRKK